jgi:hypothetical protein
MEAEKIGPEPPARHVNGRMWQYCSQAVVRSATNRSLNRPRAPTGLP